MLTRALESSEHPPATIDESRRADVPLSVDIGADDSVLDTEHYGQREDALMRATPDANTAAVIARFNRHSALVLESETVRLWQHCVHCTYSRCLFDIIGDAIGCHHDSTTRHYAAQ